ncbi:hypothetical protein GCQ56_18160 [Marinifilum sp. N1E240]|uniref:WD40/YVTN/BNR-like repeat-containing protein n=1 Tax=Marinifilum sp. N1E240 TaxID=2608082 RepID=UPI00128C6D68|nr:YCF48-related protein [Marinifilum sp. N1E240]MPQ48927.1 hypothetical protein [Marinifilum sp. N1E240]
MKKVLLILFIILSFNATAQHKMIEFHAQNSPSTSAFRSIHMVNDTCVWLGGTNGNYCYSKNGGVKWQRGIVPGAEKLDFRDLHVFSKDRVVLMSCGNGKNSRIYTTSDGGKTWKMSHQNEHEIAFYNGIDFWNSMDGILTSDAIDSKPFILITNDGGENWKRLQPNSIPDLKQGEYAFAASGTGIVTRGDSEVWIATGGIHSRIYYSEDKGKNWNASETPIIQGTSTEGIYSFFIDENKRAISVGGNYKKIEECKGNVIVSSDSGKNWKLAKGESTLAFKECVLKLKKNIWLTTGPSGTAISTDDGEHWTEIDNRPFHTMDYDSMSRTGFLAGDNGSIVKFHFQEK